MSDAAPNGTPFDSPRATEAVGAYPHARRVGNLLFLSGMGPRLRGEARIPGVVLDASGAKIDRDIRAQAQAVFTNVRLVLEDAGSSWDRIVDVTVFLTHMAEDFAAFNDEYQRAFGTVRPTRTTVEVGALPTPIDVELKVIATIE
jgi:2-aminomuconate deaminase